MKFLKLVGPNGSRIPMVGLGTWQSKSSEIETAVWSALEAGYRHIDTAFNYNNEEAIGNVLKRWFDEKKGTREDIFITTKLPHIGNRAADVEKFLNLSLEKLQLDYVDLYLIHVPFGFLYDPENLSPKVNDNGTYVLDKTTDHLQIWRALEEQVKQGKVKNLGVSNFNAYQIKRIHENAKFVKPAVLQVELHAYLQQVELRKLCKELDIAVTAYSPLGSPGAKSHFVEKYNYTPDKFPDILGHPIVMDMSAICNKTPAQVLLNHLVQQDIIVIPKSSNPTRIQENSNIFDFKLSIDQIDALNCLDRGEFGRIFNFLFWKGVENHPEYPFILIGCEQQINTEENKNRSLTEI